MKEKKHRPTNSHSAGDTSSDEGLADGEQGVFRGLHSFTGELRLLGEVDDRGHRGLAGRLPNHVFGGHFGTLNTSPDPWHWPTEPAADLKPPAIDKFRRQIFPESVRARL